MSVFRGGELVAWVVAGGAAGVMLRVAGFYARYPLHHLPPAWLVLLGTMGTIVLSGLVLWLITGALWRVLKTTRIPGWLNPPAFLVAGIATWRLAGRLPGLRFWDFGPPRSAPFALVVAGLFACAAATACLLGFARQTTTIRRGLALLLALAVPALGLVLQPPALPSRPIPSAAPRAILLVTIDTLRADHVSAYGYGRPTTPCFDALAREGLLFQRAFVPMPSTDPSHASMLTGIYPRSLGLMTNASSITLSNAESLAGYLASRGYRTMAVTSRSHLDPASMGLTGFQGWDVPSRKLREASAASTLERAATWIQRHGDQPFFLWVHFWDPHSPYDPPEPERSMFVKSYQGKVARSRSQGSPTDAPVPAAKIAYAKDLYDGEIRHADRHVGALVELVRQRVGRDNALIIVAADHGETFGELDRSFRFVFGHGYYLNTHELRVPLLFSWPGKVPEGERWENLVSTTSIAPTAAHLVDGGKLGAEAPLPRLGGNEHPSGPTAVFSERQHFREPPTERLKAAELGLVSEGWMLVDNLLAGPTLRRLDEGGDLLPPDRAADDPAAVERLRARLRDLLTRFPASAIDSHELSEEERQTLKSLGYIH